MKSPLTIEACKQHRDALAAGVSPCLLDHDTVHVLDSLLAMLLPSTSGTVDVSGAEIISIDEGVAIPPMTMERLAQKHCRSSA